MKPTHRSGDERAAGTRNGTPPDLDAWADLRAQLLARRREVMRRIASYPTPITACDAQFNHLLEQRDGLATELRRLEAAAASAAGDAAALEAFLAHCPYLDRATHTALGA